MKNDALVLFVFVDDDVLMVSFSSKKRDEADNDADDKNYLQ